VWRVALRLDVELVRQSEQFALWTCGGKRCGIIGVLNVRFGNVSCVLNGSANVYRLM
jgi:hypothetical protein